MNKTSSKDEHHGALVSRDFSAYGFWLPNDPRGSWSEFVASWELYKFGGPATKVNDRRSHGSDLHDEDQRLAAKQLLKYPPVRFDEQRRVAIADGIGRACGESDIAVHACCIGHDHVHAIVGRSAKSIERVVGQFKGRSGQAMIGAGCHPMDGMFTPDGVIHSPWSVGCWKVFIDDVRQVRTAIAYVERHPMNEGLRAQSWDFLRAL